MLVVASNTKNGLRTETDPPQVPAIQTARPVQQSSFSYLQAYRAGQLCTLISSLFDRVWPGSQYSVRVSRPRRTPIADNLSGRAC